MLTPEAGLIGLLTLVAVPNITHSQDNNADWGIRCETEGNKRCYLVQNVFLEENNQRLATLAISRQGQDYFALVSVPLGVNLLVGATIQVDAAPVINVAYQMCNLQGCHGGLAIPSSMLYALQRGKKLVISYQEPTGRNIGVPLSLKDFNTGLKNLKTALTSGRESAESGSRR